MTDITKWMEDFAEAVKAAFGERVVFIGLQGSRGRGEAGPDSDIDTVVIFDRRDMETLAVGSVPILFRYIAGSRKP